MNRCSKRRRLWQLPTQAHELLLALSFTPEWLRREAARTLGQIHKDHRVLKGRDVDMPYSVVHDLVTRNRPLPWRYWRGSCLRRSA